MKQNEYPVAPFSNETYLLGYEASNPKLTRNYLASDISGGGALNIYNSNGALTGNRTIDLNGHVLNTINGKKTETSEETSTTDIRPVIESVAYKANPSTPLTSLSDYHGIDMAYSAFGSNINNKLSLYTAEFKALNPTTGKPLRIVPLYALADSNGSGGAEDLTGFQVWTRNTGSGTVDNAYGIMVLAPVNTGGGSLLNAYGIYIPNFSTASGNNYGIYCDTKSFFRKIEVSDTSVVTNLNAEKVGGKLANTLISGTNATGTTSTSNPNTITTSGFYTATTSASNTPYSAFWSIVVVQLNNGLNYFSQVAINLETGDVWTRAIANGVPTGWVKTQRATSSTTAARPTANLAVGQSHFDTSLNIPIWWNGSVWVNATGTTV
jgi:hypothetical protein